MRNSVLLYETSTTLERLRLKICLGQHLHTMPLKTAAVSSPRFSLDFVECDPLPKAFRAMVRDGMLDVSEMALATHLIAREFGKPLTALPAPVWRRLHHANLVCLATSPIRGPKCLENKRVGVRAYSQTTGVWIRGILKTQYAVDLDSVTWVTLEDAHVTEYRDPDNVVRDTSARSLRELLHAGEVAAIMGERNADSDSVRPVIPDADCAAQDWADSLGVFPVNHVVAVRTELLKHHPWLGTELMRLLDEARVLSGASGLASLPYGLEPNRASMQMLCAFAADQKLTRGERRIEDVLWAEG